MVVDYYSRFYEVDFIRSVTSAQIIDILDKLFSLHGNPVCITSDNGPQFISSEFADYLSNEGIKHRRTTPLWPQANGKVERQNRSLMKIIRISQVEGKNWKKDVRKYLKACRSTPHKTTGVSPAELLFKRKLNTILPQIGEYVSADESVREKDMLMKEKGRLYADQTRRAQVSDLVPGDHVLLKQKKENKFTPNYETEPCEIVEKSGNSVLIKSHSIKQFKRNVTEVKKYHEMPPKSIPKMDSLSEIREVDEDASTCISEDSVPEVISSRPKRTCGLPGKFKDYMLSKK